MERSQDMPLAVVTGAWSGIGFEAHREMAEPGSAKGG